MAQRTTPSSGTSGSRSGGRRDGRGTLDAVKEDAPGALGTVAQKAKAPAVAGGAALAGLAGGLALASLGRRRRVMGIPIPGTRQPLIQLRRPRRQKASRQLLHAAKEIGSAGRQVGELTTEVQQVRGELDRGRRRSPIEVVLDGLTSRRIKS
jgi:hypothetical protein